MKVLRGNNALKHLRDETLAMNRSGAVSALLRKVKYN
jgi:hypothetical protein